LLYCYHYDPATGKYGAVISNILRLGAALTIVCLAALLLILFRMDKVASRRRWNETKTGHAVRS
jgi:protein SCO1